MKTSGRPLTNPTRSARRLYMLARDPELGRQEEVVVVGVVPVDDTHRLVRLAAIVVLDT